MVEAPQSPSAQRGRLIHDDEYEKRRVQLVDELTGTRNVRRSRLAPASISHRCVGPVGRAPLRRSKSSSSNGSRKDKGKKKKVKFSRGAAQWRPSQ